MKFKALATILLWATASLPDPVVAEERPMSLNELYNLCSQFPENSSCEGFEIPIPLDERPGVEAQCKVHWGFPQYSAPCKIDVTGSALTIYAESGEPIAALDRKRGTIEISIENDRRFSTYHHSETKVADSIILTEYQSEFGVWQESQNEQLNRTGFVQILTDKEQLAIYLQKTFERSQIENQLFWQAWGLEPTLTSKSEVVGRVSELLTTKECVRCDLRGADLQNADLENANLEGANLQGANLKNANLETAYLVGANLEKADLSDANLRHANLAMALLPEATLQRSKMKNVNLQGSILKSANLQDAQLSPANVQNADLSDANLKNANLERANFTNSNLQSANLESANLQNSYFVRSNLTGANLQQAQLQTSLVNQLENPSFLNANLTNANLENADLRNTNFNFANLRAANLTASNLENSWMMGANLREANFTQTKLEKAHLNGANLCDAILPSGNRARQTCP